MTRTRTVLVTRTEPGASRTVKRLEERGYKAIAAPIMEIRALAPDPAALSRLDAQGAAIIFTSANGVRHAPQNITLRAPTAYCVGDATALCAQDAGFKHVHSASGDAEALIRFIRENRKPDDGPLLHLANTRPRGHIVSRLADAGYDIGFAAVYETAPASFLAARFRRKLQQNPDIDAILVYSPATALHISNALEEWSGDLPAFLAISRAAAEDLEDIEGAHIIVADAPNENALFRLLEIA